MKAITHASHIILLDQELAKLGEERVSSIMFSEPRVLWVWISAMSRGREPTKV